MEYLTQLAQYYYTTTDYSYDYGTTTGEAAAIGIAAALGIIFFSLLVAAASYVIGAIFLGKIFKKAGVPSWIAWVPFYNNWKFLEIGGQQGFWAVLAIVPFVNIVSAIFILIAAYHIGKKLGKDGAFVVLAIFLPIVWLIWLAIDSSKWNDKASTAPSLHVPTPPAQPPAAA